MNKYVPGGQLGNGEGSLNVVSIGKALVFLKTLVAEGERERQFPIVDVLKRN